MAVICDNKYDWGNLTKILDERYNRYHVNAPNEFEDLTFNEVIDFGEISGNVYENAIIASLTLNDGKELINEAEYATYPLDTTINYVSRALNIPFQMFSKGGDQYNGSWFIKIKSFNDEQIKENIKRAMHLCGYYLAREEIYQNDKRFVVLRYEPKYIEDGNHIVRQCEFLYHLSPLKYKEKILKKGFIPKSNNGLFKYPDRCYFFMDTMSNAQILSWVPTFRRADKSRQNIPYCLYTIDASKINDNVIFYLDPNLKGGCYTSDNINPNVIMKVEECN
jgi:hypothetical protein